MPRELWTRDEEAIRAELALAARMQLPVILSDGRRRLVAGRLCRLVRHDPEGYVIVRRYARFRDVDPSPVSWAVYRFANRPPIVFRTAVTRTFRDLLACPIPTRLFVHQRRRHSRFFIKNQGTAAFFVANRARICQMRLADISLGGARLVGLPRYDLGFADQIGPATFSIVAEGQPVVKEITLTRATVVRHRPYSADEFEIGVRFRLDVAERLALVRLLTDPFAARLFSAHPATAVSRHPLRGALWPILPPCREGRPTGKIGRQTGR